MVFVGGGDGSGWAAEVLLRAVRLAAFPVAGSSAGLRLDVDLTAGALAEPVGLTGAEPFAAGTLAEPTEAAGALAEPADLAGAEPFAADTLAEPTEAAGAEFPASVLAADVRDLRGAGSGSAEAVTTARPVAVAATTRARPWAGSSGSAAR